MSETSKRILWVDYAKVICIFLMVVGHSGLNAVDPMFRGVFYYFHIPCFFVISGYLNNTKASFRKIFLSLAIPLFVFNLLNYPWYLYELINHGEQLDVSSLFLQPLLGFWIHDFEIGRPLCGPFWFVVVLLLDKMLISVFEPWKHKILLFAVPVACIFVIWRSPELFANKWLFMVNKAIVSLPYFMFGMFIRKNIPGIGGADCGLNHKRISLYTVSGG